MRKHPHHHLASIILGVCLFVPFAHAQEAKAPTVTKVYENDFSETADDSVWPLVDWREWKDGKGYVSFGTWMPSFRHGGLPEHQFVRARLRLHVHGPIDGTPVDEPTDYWSVSLKNGPVLLRTSFQHPQGKRGVAEGFGQAFPDEVPAGLHPAKTGAVAVNQPGIGRPDNAHYEFELVFPHQGKDLVIEFQEVFSDRANEGWYLLGFEVETISGSAPRTQKELDKLWDKLIGADAMAALQAANELVASGKKGTDFVAKRWQAFTTQAGPSQKELAAAINKPSLVR